MDTMAHGFGSRRGVAASRNRRDGEVRLEWDDETDKTSTRWAGGARLKRRGQPRSGGTTAVAAGWAAIDAQAVVLYMSERASGDGGVVKGKDLRGRDKECTSNERRRRGMRSCLALMRGQARRWG
jgi:hypothetical protein